MAQLNLYYIVCHFVNESNTMHIYIILQVHMSDGEELGDVIEDESTFREDESPDQSMEDNDDPVCTCLMLL